MIIKKLSVNKNLYEWIRLVLLKQVLMSHGDIMEESTERKLRKSWKPFWDILQNKKNKMIDGD